MRVSTFKNIFSYKALRTLPVCTKKNKVKSRFFADCLLRTKEEALFKLFLRGLYEVRDEHSKKQPAKRLFREFLKRFERLSEEEKRNFSDPFYKELQKVIGVYERKKSPCDDRFKEAAFLLADLEALLPKIQRDNYKLCQEQESKVIRCSNKRHSVRQGNATFVSLNDKAYPHSVMQLDASPKMVIIGTPRHDRNDALTRFWSIMIEERVELIVALNTAGDWEQAIPYHEPDHIASLKLAGSA